MADLLPDAPTIPKRFVDYGRGMETLEVLRGVKGFYSRHETALWAVYPEVCLAPSGSGRRADLLCVGLTSPTKFERHAIEVKVSRGDFLAELRDPEKQLLAREYCDRVYYACPPGLISLDELPEWAGLIEIWYQPELDLRPHHTIGGKPVQHIAEKGRRWCHRLVREAPLDPAQDGLPRQLFGRLLARRPWNASILAWRMNGGGAEGDGPGPGEEAHG